MASFTVAVVEVVDGLGRTGRVVVAPFPGLRGGSVREHRAVCLPWCTRVPTMVLGYMGWLIPWGTSDTIRVCVCVY